MSRITFQGINYTIRTETTIDVGYNLSENPYTSAVSRVFSGPLIIPSFISYSGNLFRVNNISSHSFYFCEQITAVVIPYTIEIILPISLVSIHANAFVGDIGLQRIYYCGIISLPSFINTNAHVVHDTFLCKSFINCSTLGLHSSSHFIHYIFVAITCLYSISNSS